ncbi:SDR family oxidoreductase [Phyllobacterium calauticae]|jgi:hypothetical protein|uniref:hypothetical protein n=1 Tax=Phyllobacterium calauticae TaxID=2817027 RepID=UPI001CBE4555|nr:hypothetical protein [Phyllobacterium calauticae]MBZ3691916.1 hypothetical protein [Phyllobacterium calauticae]
MTNPEPRTILMVGVDEKIRPALVAAFEALGGRAYWLDVPFGVPTDGTGIVSTEGETRLVEDLDCVCQAIGHVDVLVNSVSLDEQVMTTPLPSYTAIHTSALMQLSRPLKAVLPGMIIRQHGQMVTLVTSVSDTVDTETYDAVATAAAAIDQRTSAALNGDQIKTDILLHRSSFSEAHKTLLMKTIVELAMPKRGHDKSVPG